MSDTNYERFFTEMSGGPAVLLMGQDFLKRYAGEDYFLSTCQDRFGLDLVGSYDDLIAKCGEDDSTIGIFHNISNRIAVPERMQSVASLPWNSVLTSSFHDILDRALTESDWRQVNPVLDELGAPTDPRNKFRLSLFKLFGCVTRDRDTEQPPLTRLRKIQRNSVAAEMISGLHELVTPKGILIIDSLAEKDWLKREVVVGAISRMGKSQAHLFGATDADKNDEGFQLLVEDQRLVFHEKTLAEALGELHADRLRELFGEGQGWTEGVQLTFPSGKKHTFTSAEWRRLASGLTVLSDDDAEQKYEFASSDDRYKHFKDFLYGTHGTPDWQSFASGMAFRRAEFNTLQSLVLERLQKQRLNEKPILVVGQSGAGKSVALADLAVLMRQQNWPVVYFGRNETDIDAEVVSTIAADLDQVEATPLLLVWDAMVSVESFASLTNLLASLGRKVVVVGATYKTSTSATCVEFSEKMSTDDAKRFLKHLEAFDPALTEGISPSDFERRNFWAWLWRLLPESRGQLRMGLLGEAETYFQDLEKSLQNQAMAAPVAQGTLGALLAQEGIRAVQTNKVDEMDIRDARGKAASQVQSLSGFILVPGAFGEDVPVDLVLRCMGREGFEVLQTALRDAPVFRWSEDERGNHLLGARQQLEAKVFVWSSFSRSEQFEFLTKLLGSVRGRGDWPQFDSEVTFALNLLRSIGPNSSRDTTADELVALADVVKEITEQSGSNVNPWLAFQEGYLRREALKMKRDLIDWTDIKVVSETIDKFMLQYKLAGEALARAEAAYGHTSDRKQNRRLSQIHTEYAGLCGIGQDVQNRIGALPRSEQLLAHVQGLLGFGYSDAVEHCKKAVLLDTENVYSLDVQFRVIKTELSLLQQKGELDTSQHVEMVSNLCDVLGNEAWDRSPEYFGQRKLEFAEIVGDDALRNDALKQLAAAGSFAGEYLLAWKSIYYPDRTWRPDAEIEVALERIESLGSVDDPRLLRLYTTAWWRLFAKVDVFDQNSERRAIGLSHSQWQHFAKWLAKRVGKRDEVSPHALFLYAWTLFQIGDYAESVRRFRLLDQAVYAGAFRVVRVSLWSDSDGSPIVCNGTIRRIYKEGDKGWVYVPSLRREIPFRPNDFKSDRLFANQPLNDFHIAFNFRGPIADPARLAPPAMRG